MGIRKQIYSLLSPSHTLQIKLPIVFTCKCRQTNEIVRFLDWRKRRLPSEDINRTAKLEMVFLPVRR